MTKKKNLRGAETGDAKETKPKTPNEHTTQVKLLEKKNTYGDVTLAITVVGDDEARSVLQDQTASLLDSQGPSDAKDLAVDDSRNGDLHYSA